MILVRSTALFSMWVAKYKVQKAKGRRLRSSQMVCEQYKIWRVRILWRTYRICAIEIERHVRGVLARMAASRRRYVLVRAQAVARTMCWMAKYLKRHRGIVKIQSAIRMYLINQWHKHFKDAANTIRRYYIDNSLLPRRLKSWWDEASKAALNGNLSQLASLVELFDPKYSVRLSDFRNLINMKEKATKRSLLHLAVRSGSYDCVRFLLHRNAWPDEIDLSGLAPIHLSCGEGDVNQPITALLFEDWGMKGPSFYSYDPSAPTSYEIQDIPHVDGAPRIKGESEELWDDYTHMRRQYRHDFRHPTDLLQIKDDEDMTPLDYAVNSPNEHSLTVTLLVDMGATIDPDVMQEQEKHRIENQRLHAYHRIRVGEEKLAEVAKRMADPISQLMDIQTKNSIDRVTRRMQEAKERKAGIVIQKLWRGNLIRRFAALSGHTMVENRRRQLAAREKALGDRGYSSSSGTRQYEGQNLEAQTDILLDRLEARNRRAAQGLPPIQSSKSGALSGSGHRGPPLSFTDAPPEQDSRLMDLLRKAHASVYLDALKNIAGLMVVDDLLTLSNDELDEIAQMIGMKPLDKNRLKRQIDAENGKDDSPAQSTASWLDQSVAASASASAPAPAYGEEKKTDTRVEDAKFLDEESEELIADLGMQESTEAKRLVEEMDEMLHQATQDTSQRALPGSEFGREQEELEYAQGIPRPVSTEAPSVSMELLHEYLSQANEVYAINSSVPQYRSWFYRDKKGQVQGPHPRATMRQWFLKGYLKPDLPVRFGSQHIPHQGFPVEKLGGEIVGFSLLKNHANPMADAFKELPSKLTLQRARNALRSTQIGH